MCTEGGVVQLDDCHPHGAAELEVYQRVNVGEGRLPGDVGEDGVLKERGEHGLQLRLLGLAALVGGNLLGLSRDRIHRTGPPQTTKNNFLSPAAGGASQRQLRRRAPPEEKGTRVPETDVRECETDMWVQIPVGKMNGTCHALIAVRLK
jgi:hypothetical protein